MAPKTSNPTPADVAHYFVVAGEPSGDLHGSHLLQAWQQQEPTANFRGFGGPKMGAAGMEILEDLPSQGIMGLFPVLAALPKIRSWFKLAKECLRRDKPRALILIDYPGFNLRLAKAAKDLGIPVLYYISPQVWAWKRKRVFRIANVVDLMIPILPFEAQYFAATDLRCEYAGNPLVDHLSKLEPKPEFVAQLRGMPAAEGTKALGSGPSAVIGVFPGSRSHVVESLTPIFIAALQKLQRRPGFENCRCLFAATNEKLAEQIRSHPGLKTLNFELVVGDPYSVMDAADFCLSTSGTTTLELALKAKPFVLAYRVSAPFYLIAKALIRVPFIGLVNLIANRVVVPEHIGVRSFADALCSDLERIHGDPDFRETMLSGMREVREKLGGTGAYDRAAEHMLNYLDSASATLAKDS